MRPGSPDPLIDPPHFSVLSACLRREPVPRAAHGLNEPIVPEFLECFPQSADVYVDRALLDVDIPAPDAIEQLLARIDAFGMRHEELEHTVLGRTERDRVLAGKHTVARRIERKAAELDAL